MKVDWITRTLICYVIISVHLQYLFSILDPKPGEVVVDMCAASRGKTEHRGS